MAGTPTVYVICDQNCKFEGMTKEQILTAIMQAVENGEIKDVDAGFVSTIKTINGLPLKFFLGEQAAYDALSEEEKENLFAIITNDTSKAAILAAIENILTGDSVVGQAKKAETDLNGEEFIKFYKSCRGVRKTFNVNEGIDLNEYRSAEDCGVYIIEKEAIINGIEFNGNYFNFPDLSDCIWWTDDPAADSGYFAPSLKLTVEISPNKNNIIQTLELFSETKTFVSRIYKREYSSTFKSWSEWNCFVTVKELELSNKIKVNKAAHADNADFATAAAKADKANNADGAELAINATQLTPFITDFITMKISEKNVVDLDLNSLYLIRVTDPIEIQDQFFGTIYNKKYYTFLLDTSNGPHYNLDDLNSKNPDADNEYFYAVYERSYSDASCVAIIDGGDIISARYVFSARELMFVKNGGDLNLTQRYNGFSSNASLQIIKLVKFW